MDELGELQAPAVLGGGGGKRNRALSVTRTTNQQIDRMERSLDRLQSLYQEIQVDWPQGVQPHSNPLEIALPLLDTTSVGLAHKKAEFIDLKDRLSDALQTTVTEHYQAFNDSVGSYRTVVQNIANSKQTVAKIRDSITDSVNDLDQVTNNEELRNLNENVKNYNEMIAICTAIEYLQKAPNDLENSFNDKNYSKTQSILSDVSKRVNRYELWRLPALSNLKEYYKTQEQHLFEILVEELHNIMYSKTDFTHMDIKSLKGSQTCQSSYNAEQRLLGSVSIDIGETASLLHAKYDTFINSFIEAQGDGGNAFNDKPTATQFNYIRFDDDSNPFHQILKVLKLITKAGNLPLALEIITQRVTSEMDQLINKVIEDLKLKYPKLIKSLNTSISNNSNSNNNNINSNNIKGNGITVNDSLSSSSSADLILVSELFWNFFRKILFFFQAVKSIVVISETLQPSLKKNVASLELLKLWNIMKDEIERFIMAYISTEDSNDLKKTTSINNQSVQETSSFSKIFQFYQVDYNKEHSDNLKGVLVNLFPGLVNSKDISKIDSPYIEDSKLLKQTRILPANVMHMKYIIEPFLLFVQGTNLLILNEGTLEFFNRFMGTKFLPLLEEHFVNYYIEEIEGIDSLEIYKQANYDDDDDDDDELENEKYLLFVVEFKFFLDELCISLNASSQFRPDFVKIIFRIILKFIDKIKDIYKEIFNELINFLEPNKEFILLLTNSTRYVVSKAKIRRDVINRNEYQNNRIIKNLKYLDNSLTFIIRLLSSNLIKTNPDIGKTDGNLSHIEKVRKNWYFLEINDIGENYGITLLSNHDFTSVQSMKNQHKIILDDELRLNFSNTIVLNVQKIQGDVRAVMDKYNTILSLI